MDSADLPAETAQEPTEEAHQPLSQSTMSPPFNGPKQKKGITFAAGTQSSEISSSQCNSSYKDALSQPGPGLSHRQRLLWVQRRRKTGLFVQCDDCSKWRYLPHIVDKHELPNKWYCRLNPDRTESDCSVPEAPIRLRDEEDLIHSEYSAGSVVWARLTGWPWWPAMVDDCPDTEQFYWLDGFSDIPTHYNVVFFDAIEVTRAWIAPENLKPYRSHRKDLKHVVKNRRYRKRLEVAFRQADDADMLPLANRLEKYSFVARYTGTVGSPKKVGKRELEKFKNKLKRHLEIDFSDDSDESDSGGSVRNTENAASSVQKRQEMRNKNVILIGTPKKAQRSVKRSRNETQQPNEVGIVMTVAKDTDETNQPGETLNTVDHTDSVLKQADSMTVQIGTTSINDTMTIDNDSSKTYLPDSEIGRAEDSQTEPEFQVRIATPSSDDFEF